MEYQTINGTSAFIKTSLTYSSIILQMEKRHAEEDIEKNTEGDRKENTQGNNLYEERKDEYQT